MALTGCPRTVYAPAWELPGLAPINMAQSEDYPTITTQSGDSQRLAGPIQEVKITHSGGIDALGPDFNAGIVGDNLSVIDARGPRVYSLATKPYLTIDYTDRKTGYVVGGVALIAGGLPISILGVVTMVEGADLADSGNIIDGAFGVGLSFIGLVIVGTGVGLTVGGIVLATSTPEKPTKSSAMTTPKLHFGPNGAGVSVKF